MPEPIVYAVRLMPPAREVIDAERDRLLSAASIAAAERWTQIIDTALSSLAVYPHRCAIARESVLFAPHVRQLLVPPRHPRWRVLFTVHDGGDDAPTVRVHLLRPAAQAPLADWPGSDA